MFFQFNVRRAEGVAWNYVSNVLFHLSNQFYRHQIYEPIKLTITNRQVKS